MTTLLETCKLVIEAGEKASLRPWKYERISHDPDQFSYEFFESDFHFAIYEANYDKPMKAKFDADFIASSANNAEKLARACMILMEAAKKHHNCCITCQSCPSCELHDAIKQANALFDGVKG